ncbi:hypothetical protein [Metallibacterium sp.]|uniref:hypothetical protein n=1 Tax=Metallibacterium sp. TaxID=2940281 RepID=UPI00262D96B8|nr:hypothetical protein [Metallibacterium sp.]
MIASSPEDWLMVVVSPLCEIEPLPPTITPPVGVVPGGSPGTAKAEPQNRNVPATTAAKDTLSDSSLRRGSVVRGLRAACVQCAGLRDAEFFVAMVLLMIFSPQNFMPKPE